MHIATSKGTVDGIMTLPPTKGHYPGVVLLHGDECVPPAMVQGAVRALGMHGTVLMAFSPSGCGKKEGASASNTAADAVHVLKKLSSHPEVGKGRSGFLGIGDGCIEAVRATLLPGARPNFLICLSERKGEVPDVRQVARVPVPSLWVVPAGRAWNSFRKKLEFLRDKEGKPLTIVVDDLESAPAITAKGVSSTSAGETGSLVQAISTGHASLAASWLKGLKKD